MSQWSAGLLPSPMNAEPGFKLLEQSLRSATSFTDAVFSVAPGGATDVSGQVQAAIDAASAVGGTVAMGGGAYTILGVVVKSNVRFLNTGGGYFLRPPNTGNFTRMMYCGRGVNTQVKNVVFDGIVWNGNIANQLNSSTDYNATTDTIAFNGSYQQNHSLFLGFEAGYPGVGCDNIRFINCTFNGSQGDGLAINQYATNIAVVGMSGRGCGRGSFDLFGGSSSVKVDASNFADWFHIENDNPTGTVSTCEITTSYAARMNALGPAAGNGLVVHIDNCRVDYGPQFEQVGGTVTDTTFTIPVSADGSGLTHRVIKSEDLVFTSCRFIGTSAVTSGKLVSTEPDLNTPYTQNVTFQDCLFLAQGGTKAVNGLDETTAFHPLGSRTTVRGCTFRNLAVGVAPRRNGMWRVLTSIFDLCGAGVRGWHSGGVSVELLHAIGNEYYQCDAQIYLADNHAAIGAQTELYERHWNHATLLFPPVTSAFGTSNVTAVKDRREFWSTKAQFDPTSATGVPATWSGAKVWITDAAVAGDKMVYQKTGTTVDPTTLVNGVATGRTFLSVALA